MRMLKKTVQQGRSENHPTPHTSHKGEWPRLPFTARIERAHSYRARSASKKGTWPLPAPFFNILILRYPPCRR